MSCDPCLSPVVVNIPGPIGINGADGTDGADGTNAFTFLTAAGVMPGYLGSATETDIFDVIDSTWAVVGQTVFVQFAGEFEVVFKPTPTSITLRNLEDPPNSAYLANVPPGTAIPNGSQVSPSGQQGAAGTVPANVALASETFITQTPGATSGQPISVLNPSGLLKFATGTGILARAIPGTDFLDPATGLEPADIGVTVQARSANLDAVTGLVGVADQLPYFTGPAALALATLTAFIRTLLDDANASAARLTLGVRYGLLGSVAGLDLNTGGAPVDLPAITINSTKYVVDRVLAVDASISLTVATLGLFGSAGGGVPVICANQSLAALTGPTKQMPLAISGAGSTDIITSATLIPRLGTPQGAPATVSLWVFGYDLS